MGMRTGCPAVKNCLMVHFLRRYYVVTNSAVCNTGNIHRDLVRLSAGDNRCSRENQMSLLFS